MIVSFIRSRYGEHLQWREYEGRSQDLPGADLERGAA